MGMVNRVGLLQVIGQVADIRTQSQDGRSGDIFKPFLVVDVGKHYVFGKSALGVDDLKAIQIERIVSVEWAETVMRQLPPK